MYRIKNQNNFENKEKGVTLRRKDFKIYYEAILIKTVLWYSYKDRQIDRGI